MPKFFFLRRIEEVIPNRIAPRSGIGSKRVWRASDNADAVQESSAAEENAGTGLLRRKEIQRRPTYPAPPTGSKPSGLGIAKEFIDFLLDHDVP